MSKRPTTGRNSIFRGKDDGKNFNGVVTKAAAFRFEQARRRLAKMAERETASDADTIEFLARGEANTLAYLRKTKQIAG